MCAGETSSGEESSVACASRETWRGSDLMFSSNARSSRPSIHAATAAIGVAAAAIFAPRRITSARVISVKTAATGWSFESKWR